MRFNGEVSTRSGVVLDTNKIIKTKGIAVYGPYKLGKCSNSTLNNDEFGCLDVKKTWNSTHCNPRKQDGTLIPNDELTCVRTSANIWSQSKLNVEYGVPHQWWKGMYDGKGWERSDSDGKYILQTSKNSGIGRVGIEMNVPVKITTFEIRGLSVISLPLSSQQKCTLEIELSEIDSVLSPTRTVIKVCVHDTYVQPPPLPGAAGYADYDIYVPVLDLLDESKHDVEIDVYQIFLNVFSRVPRENGMKVRVVLRANEIVDESTKLTVEDFMLGISDPHKMLEDTDSSSLTLETWVRHTNSLDNGKTNKWNKFWWWLPGAEWPSIEDDVLRHMYGHCKESDTHCFQRLPEGLEEDFTEMMAEDHSGNTRFVWRFDSTNSISHAAWRALRYGEETPIHEDLGTTSTTVKSNEFDVVPQAVWGRPRHENWVRNGDFAQGNPVQSEGSSTAAGGAKCVVGALTCGTRSIRAQVDGPPRGSIDDNIHGYSGYVLHFGNTGSSNDGTYVVKSSRDIGLTSGTIRVEAWMRRSTDYDGALLPMSLVLKDSDNKVLDIVETIKTRESITKDRWESVYMEYNIKTGNTKSIHNFELTLSPDGSKKGHLELTHIIVNTISSWNPTPIKGRDGSIATFHGTAQRAFVYARPQQAAGAPTSVKSLLLSGDACDCRSSLSLGQSFCTTSTSRGVDALNDNTGPDASGASCSVPKMTNGLTLYYRDTRDTTRRGSTSISPSSGVSIRQVHFLPKEKIGIDFWVKVDGASGPAATEARKNSLVGWYDANDKITVDIVDGNIQQWKDRSGAERHLS